MVQAVEAVEAVPPEQAGALAAVVVDDPRGAFQGGERGFAISETYFLIWAMCDACVHEVILRRQSLEEEFFLVCIYHVLWCRKLSPANQPFAQRKLHIGS